MLCFLCGKEPEEKEVVGRRSFAGVEKVICANCVRLANAVFARKEKIEYLDFIRH